MRQRAPVQSPASKEAVVQRGGRQQPPSSREAWEITSEQAIIEDSSPLRNRKYPQHYQNGVQFHTITRVEKTPLSFEKPRLEDFHTMYRTPLHVPDRKYREMVDAKYKRKRKGNPYISEECCISFCSGFSVIAVLFLVFVGILLDTQPLYMKGVLPAQAIQANDSGKLKIHYVLPSERLPIASTAYKAAFAYVLTIGVCVCTLHRGWIRSQLYKRKNRYEDIPDHFSAADSTIPTFHRPGDDDDEPATEPYQPTLWEQAKAAIQQWLILRGYWRRPGQRFRRKGKSTPKTL